MQQLVSASVPGRSAAKRYLGPLTAPVLAMLLRLTPRRRGVAVLYHEVLDDGHPRPEERVVPAIRQSRLRQQLRHLRRHYEIVPLDRFDAAVRARRRGQRFPVCLTFDDDAPEHVRYAMPVLTEHGAPATFFLNGAFLGSGLWWQHLQRALDRGVPLAEIAAAAGVPAGDAQAVADAIEALPPEAPRRGVGRAAGARRPGR